MLEVADRAQANTDNTEFQDARDGDDPTATDPTTAPANTPAPTAGAYTAPTHMPPRSSTGHGGLRVSTLPTPTGKGGKGKSYLMPLPTDNRIHGEGVWQMRGRPQEFLGITDNGYKFVIGDLGPHVTPTDVQGSVLCKVTVLSVGVQ